MRDVPSPPPGRTGWPWTAEHAVSREESCGDLPRITVVTPSFNQAEFLEETIRSVLLQNYPNLQYIVADGGSTDGSSEILDRYRDAVDVIIQEPDRGQSDAISKALRLADGKFFNWINSDDLLKPGVLQEVGSCFPADADLYTVDVEVFQEGAESYVMKNENLSARRILRADPYSFSQPGLWFRLSHLRECGGIDTELQYGFDWDLLIRYLARFPRVRYSRTVGAAFRIHGSSKTAVESSREQQDANRFRQESLRTRDKLEAMLEPRLAAASRLGRLREPWNARLIAILDDLDRSPASAVAEIIRDAFRQPRVRLSRRTLGAVVRLLSRYVRSRSSLGRSSPGPSPTAPPTEPHDLS